MNKISEVSRNMRERTKEKSLKNMSYFGVVVNEGTHKKKYDEMTMNLTSGAATQEAHESKNSCGAVVVVHGIH